MKEKERKGKGKDGRSVFCSFKGEKERKRDEEERTKFLDCLLVCVTHYA